MKKPYWLWLNQASYTIIFFLPSEHLERYLVALLLNFKCLSYLTLKLDHIQPPNVKLQTVHHICCQWWGWAKNGPANIEDNILVSWWKGCSHFGYGSHQALFENFGCHWYLFERTSIWFHNCHCNCWCSTSGKGDVGRWVQVGGIGVLFSVSECDVAAEVCWWAVDLRLTCHQSPLYLEEGFWLPLLPTYGPPQDCILD